MFAAFRLILVAITSSLLLGIVPATAAPLAAYGRLPTIEDAQMSPDGKLVALSVTDGDKRTIIIKRLSDGEVVGSLGAGDLKVRRTQWAGTRYLIVTISQTASLSGFVGPAREYWVSIVYDMTTGKTRALMAKVPGALNFVLDYPAIRTINGEPYAVVQSVNVELSVAKLGLFRIRLRDGVGRMQEPGFDGTEGWVVGQDGDALAQTEYDEKTGRWQLRLHQGGAWPVIDSANGLSIDRPQLAGMGREAGSVLLISGDDDDGLSLTEYTAGATTGVSVTDAAFDDLLFDPATHLLIGFSTLAGDERRMSFLDPRADKAWKAVVKAFPGDHVRLVSWSDSRRQIVVLVDSPTLGLAYSVVDLDAGSAAWLGPVYGGLADGDIAEVRPVSYKAGDGLTITGYLTLPRGREAKGLPLIVLPHGGPAGRDEPGFDWWPQALASRGYAVLQPNFRGSTGLGLSFQRAGEGEFGRKMQTDLSDGVRYLSAQGVVDAKRVCIVGASYGGYAALAGVTLETGVYRCAAAVAGVSNLKRFLQSRTFAGYRDNSTLRYWTRLLGVESQKDPELAEISPILNLDRLTAPVLLVHGRDDTIVPYDQSIFMAAALKAAGKPVEFVTLNGEDHWLSRSDTRLQMLTAVVAFVEKHNPPD